MVRVGDTSAFHLHAQVWQLTSSAHVVVVTLPPCHIPATDLIRVRSGIIIYQAIPVIHLIRVRSGIIVYQAIPVIHLIRVRSGIIVYQPTRQYQPYTSLVRSGIIYQVTPGWGYSPP